MRKQDKDRNGKPEALLWVDVETTGVDRDLDELLEVGMRCTSVDATETYGTLTRLAKPQCLTLDDFTPVSFSMHCDSGLLPALLDSDPRQVNRKAVVDAILEFLDSLAQRFTLVPRERTWISTWTSCAGWIRTSCAACRTGSWT